MTPITVPQLSSDSTIDNRLRMGLGEVHVWLLQPEHIASSPELFAAAGDVLSAAERARALRMLIADKRCQFVVTRAYLRFLLSRYAPHVSPRDWSFVATSHGRPVFDDACGPSGLSFNVSHVQGLSAIAIARDTYSDVGVDVEDCSRGAHAVDFSLAVFDPQEAQEVRELPAQEQKRRFFSRWTLKEAYLKARGIGLSIPLNQFYFRQPRKGNPTLVLGREVEDDASTWQFATFEPTARHVVSVAIRRGIGPDLAIRMKWAHAPSFAELEKAT